MRCVKVGIGGETKCNLVPEKLRLGDLQEEATGPGVNVE